MKFTLLCIPETSLTHYVFTLKKCNVKTCILAPQRCVFTLHFRFTCGSPRFDSIKASSRVELFDSTRLSNMLSRASSVRFDLAKLACGSTRLNGEGKSNRAKSSRTAPSRTARQSALVAVLQSLSGYIGLFCDH